MDNLQSRSFIIDFDEIYFNYFIYIYTCYGKNKKMSDPTWMIIQKIKNFKKEENGEKPQEFNNVFQNTLYLKLVLKGNMSNDIEQPLVPRNQQKDLLFYLDLQYDLYSLLF